MCLVCKREHGYSGNICKVCHRKGWRVKGGQAYNLDNAPVCSKCGTCNWRKNGACKTCYNREYQSKFNATGEEAGDKELASPLVMVKSPSGVPVLMRSKVVERLGWRNQ